MKSRLQPGLKQFCGYAGFLLSLLIAVTCYAAGQQQATQQAPAAPTQTPAKPDLDRDAFTFTNYDLVANVDPPQHTLQVRGKVTLRNDSQKPQSQAVLQISSSLRWASVKAAATPLEFTQGKLDSDVDHTGALNEAVVTLPGAIPPQGTIELEVGYSGTVPLISNRLAKLGTPAELAYHSDWDQISEVFTALRGIGYVTWYPIATAPASMANGNEVFEEVGKWKLRHQFSTFRVSMSAETPATMRLLGNGYKTDAAGVMATANFGFSSPVLANTYPTALSEQHNRIKIQYGAGSRPAADDYLNVAEAAGSVVSDWFGVKFAEALVLPLPDPRDASYDGGPVLLTPLKTTDRRSAELLLTHTLAHGAFYSPRVWMDEGAAHFAQALMREGQEGRKAALQYMGDKRSALALAEPDPAKLKTDPRAGQSLVNCYDEVYYRTKAMYVWWMLRDLVGDSALRAAIAKYRPEDDKQPAYFQKLLETESRKDLEWFFDDWVYRDRGLPEFRISSATARESLRGAYLVVAMIENTGAAAADVPVMVSTPAGEVLTRQHVPARGKAVARIEVGLQPISVQVNDGSVPETDPTDNFAVIRLQIETTIPLPPRPR